jgi:hypothetical protein
MNEMIGPYESSVPQMYDMEVSSAYLVKTLKPLHSYIKTKTPKPDPVLLIPLLLLIALAIFGAVGLIEYWANKLVQWMNAVIAGRKKRNELTQTDRQES